MHAYKCAVLSSLVLLLLPATVVPQTIPGRIERVAAFARDKGWKHIRLLSAANSTFKRDYHGEGADGQQAPIMTVFKRWPDGVIRLHWASELLFEPSDPGQDMRHMGTVEPLWTLFDLTPGGRPNAEEQIEYCCG